MASDEESIPDIAYSREATVAAVQDFIAFATKMYLDEEAYESPPSAGWPSITPDSMQFFGKTGEVVELLRHLPCPSDRYWHRRPQIMPALSFAAFQHDIPTSGMSADQALKYRAMTEGHGILEHVPPSVVGLAKRPAGDHGVLLDTKRGLVYWHEAAGELRWLTPYPVVEVPNDWDEDSEGESMSPGERSWRENSTAWLIPHFFATLKHNLKELHFVPMSKRRVVDGWYESDSGQDDSFQEAVDMVKGIYREHGWPDLERYRKEECLRAIRRGLSENFPDEMDEEDSEEDEDVEEDDESLEGDA